MSTVLTALIIVAVWAGIFVIGFGAALIIQITRPQWIERLWK